MPQRALFIALAERILFSLVIAMDTQLTWYGQSAFKIVTPNGHVLLIDPWLTNPVHDRGKDEVAGLKRVDLILVTHGHSDHVGDAVEIGKKTRAKLVATFDLSAAKSQLRLCPRGMAPEFPKRKPHRRFTPAIPPD